MRWFEKPEVLDYIIESYAGLDGHKRQFIWEDEQGDVVIGNSRAFTDYCSIKFNLGLHPASWCGIHEALRMLGEVVHGYSPRVKVRGRRFKNQIPEIRVLKRHS